MEVDYFLRVSDVEREQIRDRTNRSLQILKQDHKFPRLIAEIIVQMHQIKGTFFDGA